MLKIPQLDLQQKHQDHSGSGDQLVWEYHEYVHDPVASAKDRKNFENRTDINSTKILKQLLSLLNNILTL